MVVVCDDCGSNARIVAKDGPKIERDLPDKRVKQAIQRIKDETPSQKPRRWTDTNVGVLTKPQYGWVIHVLAYRDEHGRARDRRDVMKLARQQAWWRPGSRYLGSERQEWFVFEVPPEVKLEPATSEDVIGFLDQFRTKKTKGAR